jgi:hypothetical protein
MIELSRSEWMSRQARHHARVDALLADHRWRSSRGIKHPVEDFLFEYYTFRPYQLRHWHPGAGVALADAADWAPNGNYLVAVTGVRLDTATVLAARARTVTSAHALLAATSRRRPAFGCFGMHEWAMVDGLPTERTRHPQLGLRRSPAQISATLRTVGLRCTHVDAHRFFPSSAAQLNEFSPTRDNQIDLDQPGCLHVGMDLYRLAYKLSPMIHSELVADCFELARRIRVLDVRASPYDVSSLGLTPVLVETSDGRAQYAAEQRGLALAAEPLRAKLLQRTTQLVGRGETGEASSHSGGRLTT